MIKSKMIFLLIISLALLGNITSQSKLQAQIQNATAEPVQWATVADDYYGYSFQIPSSWYKQMGATPDRWTFLSDSAALYTEDSESIHPPSPEKGVIYLEFKVDPVPNWLPVPEVRNPLVDEWGNATSDALIPLLPPGTWTTVNGLPTLIVEEDLSLIREGDGGPFTKAKSIYILTERMVYYLWIAYAPPLQGDKAVAESSYEKIVTDILSNFSVNIEAPAVWHPLER